MIAFALEKVVPEVVEAAEENQKQRRPAKTFCREDWSSEKARLSQCIEDAIARAPDEFVFLTGDVQQYQRLHGPAPVPRSELVQLARHYTSITPEALASATSWSDGDLRREVLRGYVSTHVEHEFFSVTDGGGYRVPRRKADLRGFAAKVSKHWTPAEPSGKRLRVGPRQVKLRKKPLIPTEVARAASRFVSIDPSRPVLHQVVQDGNFSIGTDGRRAVVVLGSASVTAAEVGFPNWRRVFPSWVDVTEDTIGHSRYAGSTVVADTRVILQQLREIQGCLDEYDTALEVHSVAGQASLKYENHRDGVGYHDAGISEEAIPFTFLHHRYLVDLFEFAVQLGLERLELRAESSTAPAVFRLGPFGAAVIMPARR